MNLEKLLKLFKKYNVPDDVTLMSDSGWECSATDMNGAYYNKKLNVVVFTQSLSVADDYYEMYYIGLDHWVPLFESDKQKEKLVNDWKNMYDYMDDEYAWKRYCDRLTKKDKKWVY